MQTDGQIRAGEPGGAAWQEVPAGLPAVVPGGTIERPDLHLGYGAGAHGAIPPGTVPAVPQTAPHAPDWPDRHPPFTTAMTPQKAPEQAFEIPGLGK